MVVAISAAAQLRSFSVQRRRSLTAPQITLASASPRRAALLRQIGISFEICVSGIVEERLTQESPESYVKRLAKEKAAAVQHGSLPALGADTTVVLDGQILEKPENRADGLRMLQQLQGRSHKVLTAVSLCDAQRDSTVLASALVNFREADADELARYWRSGEPIDKAGAYGIQGLGAIFIASVCGQPSTVAGLPLVETNQVLRDFGIDVWLHRQLASIPMKT